MQLEPVAQRGVVCAPGFYFSEDKEEPAADGKMRNKKMKNGDEGNQQSGSNETSQTG